MSDDAGFAVEAVAFRAATADRSHLGLADLAIDPIGLVLVDCRLIRAHRGLRIVVPARCVQERGTNSVRLDLAGKPVLVRHVTFPATDAWDRFSRIAIEAIGRAFPAELATALAIERVPTRAEAAHVQPTREAA